MSAALYEGPPAPVADPYSEAYNQPSQTAPMDTSEPAPLRRSRSRSPPRANGEYKGAPPPRRDRGVAPSPSNVLGVFGLSIRTQERDLDDEFSRYGTVERVTIVYDQRSDRSRGFGFIKMSTVEDATKCIEEMNGVELQGRKIRVDYSVTERPHAPTPGEYMGHRRSSTRDDYRRDRRDDRRGGGDYRRDRGDYRDRDRDYRKDRDRDTYGRDRDRDWRDRRSPPPRSSRGYSPDYRRRRSYSRSPPRGGSPSRHDSRW